MTDELGNNTMTPGKLAILMLVGLALWVGIIFGGCKAKDALAISPYQACDKAITFPVRVHIGDGVDPAPWRAAIAEWGYHYPGAFVEGAGDVEIVDSPTTWVELPCGNKPAVIHSGHDVSLAYWASHEFVHVLAVKDYVPAGTNITGYINPGTCPGNYSGIASYCTQRSEWWGADDAVGAANPVAQAEDVHRNNSADALAQS